MIFLQILFYIIYHEKLFFQMIEKWVVLFNCKLSGKLRDLPFLWSKFVS